MQLAPVNALNPQMIEALDTQLNALLADDSNAAVVLTSGLRVFSAGADAGHMATLLNEKGPQGLVNEFNRTMDTFRELCIRLRRSPVLFIAAMNGHTLAGGLELAAACDLRFCADSERVQVGVPEMDLFGALPSGGGGAQFLARILGPARALEFILEAKPVSPETALRMGLIERLYAPGDLLPKTEEFAAAVARKAGRIGVSAAKRAILGGWEVPLQEAMLLDQSVHWDCMRRGNFLAGVADFVNRFGSSK
jgi:enoyl-CoA hydratase